MESEHSGEKGDKPRGMSVPSGILGTTALELVIMDDLAHLIPPQGEVETLFHFQLLVAAPSCG
jgi:hypothetical protein